MGLEKVSGCLEWIALIWSKRGQRVASDRGRTILLSKRAGHSHAVSLCFRKGGCPPATLRHFHLYSNCLVQRLRASYFAFATSTANTYVGPNMFDRNTTHF